MVEDKLTWQDNNTITYPTKKDAGKYEDGWHVFVLTLEDYKANAFYCPFDVDFSLDPLKGEAWKPLTEDGVKDYLSQRLSAVKLNDGHITYSITGRGRLAKDETITVAAVQGSRREAKVPPDFRSTYSEIEVGIIGRDRDERGLIRFSAANENFGESLSFDASVLNDKLEPLVEMISRSPRPPVLRVVIQAMMFCPSWRGLAPIDFPTEYLYPADLGFRVGVITSLTVTTERETVVDPVTNEPIEKQDVVVQSIDPETKKMLAQISTALWLLVGMVSAFAISRWFQFTASG